MSPAFQDTVLRLRGAGLVLRPVDIAAMLASPAEANQTVLFYEGARFHEERYRQYGDRLGVLADLVRDGLRMPIKQYQDATRSVSYTHLDVYKRQLRRNTHIRWFMPSAISRYFCRG